jgi:molybdopterin/thiamine biosynthesis adenylyltransferase
MKPVFIPKGTYSKVRSSQYLDSKVVDFYKELIEELFLIRNPKFKFIQEYKTELNEFIKDYTNGLELENCGQWVYFPWIDTIVHILDENEHQELRTARNRNLITEAEQSKLYDFKIAIAGLSVGSHPALTTTMMGMCKNIKIADPDEISGSNLNRIRYDFTKVGSKKCDVVEELIYQMNPYADVVAFNTGVDKNNIDNFLEGIDLLVEEVDNLEMKITLRQEAKKRGIPVLMATDNGDGVIIDIERYDLDKNLSLFNGALGNITIEEFSKIPPSEMPKLATKIAGPSIVDTRMLLSLSQVGKTIYSWPQLGDAATLCGVVIAYLVKRIALDLEVKTGKIEVNLDSIFDPKYFTETSKGERDEIRRSFMKAIGLE